MTEKTDSHKETRLVRSLGLLDATMIVMGSMIGSGIFIVSAESSRLIGAPGWLLLTWVVAVVGCALVVQFLPLRLGEEFLVCVLGGAL